MVSRLMKRETHKLMHGCRPVAAPSPDFFEVPVKGLVAVILVKTIKV